MVDLIKALINIIFQDRVINVIVTIAISYFTYKTVNIFLDVDINKGKDPYENKQIKINQQKTETITNRVDHE